MIRVELFGIARLRAGCEVVELAGRSLGDVLRALEQHCPGLVPEVLECGKLRESFLASQNGDRFLRASGDPLAPGDHLIILSAQAGG